MDSIVMCKIIHVLMFQQLCKLCDFDIEAICRLCDFDIDIVVAVPISHSVYKYSQPNKEKGDRGNHLFAPGKVITFRIRKQKFKKFLQKFSIHKAASSSSSSSSATKVLQWQLETLRLQCAKNCFAYQQTDELL
jgi:hypothetical protein